MIEKKRIRPIAIYLPQFHPIPENDEWWGKGFTEWTKVTKAKPLFKGHYQPHLPADLGFYDLRLSEIREAQAAMAKEYGIYGFCYYHYWFNGKRLLERPFEEVFKSGKPDFPFMLCWANENWTRVWNGKDKDILIKQEYSEEDDRNHIRSLIPYLKDNRYIKVDGKPILAIYKSTELPDAKRTVAIWKEECRLEGLELYLCRFEKNEMNGKVLLEESNFDAAIDFQPFGLGREELRIQRQLKHAGISRLFHVFKKIFYKIKGEKSLAKYMDEVNSILSYKDFIELSSKVPFPKYKFYPGVTPGWDNSARKTKGYLIFRDSTPDLFRKWLKSVLERFVPYSKDENFLFINAWNEWAEGNHLEPCQKWGRQYLEVIKELCG